MVVLVVLDEVGADRLRVASGGRGDHSSSLGPVAKVDSVGVESAVFVQTAAFLGEVGEAMGAFFEVRRPAHDASILPKGRPVFEN